MRKHSLIFKYIVATILALLVIVSTVIFCLYQSLRTQTPQLSFLAQKVGKPAFAVAFNYSKNIDQQLYLFSKNIGLENNPRTQQVAPPLGEIGARGFLIADLKPQYSKKIFTILDEVLSDLLNFIDEGSTEESEFFDPRSLGSQEQNKIFFSHQDKHIKSSNEINPAQIEESPFTKPLSSLVEEIWNGPTLLIGGVTQLQLSPKDSIQLSIEPYLKKVIHLSSNTLNDLLIKNTPLSIQSFLNNHAIDISVKSLPLENQNEINHSQINLSVTDPSEFLNSICSVKINPWDFCGRFSFPRDKFRKNLEGILSLLNNDFKLSFNIYWKIKGRSFIFSNQKSFVNKMINSETASDSNNIITSVSSSGDDFLLPTKSSDKFSSISFLFDMIRAQNEIIDFTERMRQNSNILSDYFSSPTGEIFFSNLENTINNLTGYSEKASLTLDTDGNKLIPEIRLYSPSGDLFLNNGKDLSPEVINSIRVFVTKSISFGNYLLPRGLVPIPGPYIQRNGKWVIINSEIMVKLMAPYLESVDPYIDNYYDPTNL